MSLTRRMLLRVANKGTKFIGATWGETFPMYYVCEYPKSGGTWLCRMVSDTLRVPFPQHPRLPIAHSSVIHNHWRYNPKLRRVFYLYRDGRDIMVSFYFHRMRRLQQENRAGDLEYFSKIFGKGFDADDVRTNLPAFIRNEFTSPRDARITWSKHIEQWYDPENRPHIAYLSYEQLLTDATETVRKVCEQLSGKAVDEYRLKIAIEKNSMAQMTQRAPGEEDRTSFIRKGIVGDWMNHFTPESAQIFSQYAASTLVKLGYESNERWTDDYNFNPEGGCVPKGTPSPSDQDHAGSSV